MKRVLASALLGVLSLSAAHAQDPSIPFFRSLSGFGRDTNPDGNPSYGLASEDIDFRDTPTPQNTAVTIVGKNYDGATVSTNLKSDDFGFFAAKNFAQLSVSNAQNQGYYALAGRGSHTTVEFFTPEALAERAVFHWHVTGNSNTNVGTAGSRIDFAAGSYASTDFNGFFDIAQGPRLQAFGPGDYTYTLPMTLNQPIDLFYWSSAFVEVKDSEIGPVVGGAIHAVADFSSTYVLDKIELFDTDGNAIPQWSMAEQSTGVVMFTEQGRTAAAGAIGGSSIPEPSSVLFVTVGGTLVIVARRRSIVARRR